MPMALAGSLDPAAGNFKHATFRSRHLKEDFAWLRPPPLKNRRTIQGLPRLPAARILASPSCSDLKWSMGKRTKARPLPAWKTLKGMRESAYGNSGHAWRSLHAKSHGIVIAALTVLENIPAVLAQGLFSEAGSYKTLMRFSTLPAMIREDSVSMPRGVALKVQGVHGERCPAVLAISKTCSW